MFFRLSIAASKHGCGISMLIVYFTTFPSDIGTRISSGYRLQSCRHTPVTFGSGITRISLTHRTPSAFRMSGISCMRFFHPMGGRLISSPSSVRQSMLLNF